MNTNELRCILSRDPKIRHQLVDVFAMDEFKNFVFKNKFLVNGVYIINDQVSTQSGNHWILIHVTDKEINFVDSFANPPYFYKVENELQGNRVLNKVTNRLQSYFSDVCGEYAIFFSYHLCRGKHLHNLTKYFTTKYCENDEKVKYFVHKLYPGHNRI